MAMAEMRVVVDVSRMDEFERQVAAGALAEAVKASSFEVEGIAKRLAPVDTGALRASIFTRFQGEGTETTGQVGPTVDYAIYQEFGTSKMPAHPFLRPALEDVKPRFIARVRDILNRLVRK